MNLILKIKDILIAIIAALLAGLGFYNLGRKSKEIEYKLNNEKKINEDFRNAVNKERKISDLSDDYINNRLRKGKILH